MFRYFHNTRFAERLTAGSSHTRSLTDVVNRRPYPMQRPDDMFELQQKRHDPVVLDVAALRQHDVARPLDVVAQLDVAQYVRVACAGKHHTATLTQRFICIVNKPLRWSLCSDKPPHVGTKEEILLLKANTERSHVFRKRTAPPCGTTLWHFFEALLCGTALWHFYLTDPLLLLSKRRCRFLKKTNRKSDRRVVQNHPKTFLGHTNICYALSTATAGYSVVNLPRNTHHHQ